MSPSTTSSSIKWEPRLKEEPFVFEINEDIKAVKDNMRKPLKYATAVVISNGTIESFANFPLELKRAKLFAMNASKMDTLKGFPHTPALRELHITEGNFRTLEGLPNKMEKLKHFSVTGANVEKLTGMPEMPNAKEIDITLTKIKTLEGMPKRLPKLEELNLSMNKLVSVKGISEMPNLKTLNLYGNPIKTLKDISNIKSNSIETISLSPDNLYTFKGVPREYYSKMELSSIHFVKLKNEEREYAKICFDYRAPEEKRKAACDTLYDISNGKK